MPSALELMLLRGGRDEDMQRALSSQLRRRQEIGELAQLTGDKVLTTGGVAYDAFEFEASQNILWLVGRCRLFLDYVIYRRNYLLRVYCCF